MKKRICVMLVAFLMVFVIRMLVMTGDNKEEVWMHYPLHLARITDRAELIVIGTIPFSIHKAEKLAEEFNQKRSNKNLTLEERKELEKTYIEALRKMSNNAISLEHHEIYAIKVEQVLKGEYPDRTKLLYVIGLEMTTAWKGLALAPDGRYLLFLKPAEFHSKILTEAEAKKGIKIERSSAYQVLDRGNLLLGNLDKDWGGRKILEVTYKIKDDQKLIEAITKLCELNKEADIEKIKKTAYEMLESNEIIYQEYAISTLGKLKDKGVVNKLLELLKSPNRALQETALDALIEIGDLNAIDTIKEVRKDPETGFLSVATRSAIGKIIIQNSDMVEFLKDEMHPKNPEESSFLLAVYDGWFSGEDEWVLEKIVNEKMVKCVPVLRWWVEKLKGKKISPSDEEIGLPSRHVKILHAINQLGGKLTTEEQKELKDYGFIKE
jgi:hypothetical protein